MPLAGGWRGDGRLLCEKEPSGTAASEISYNPITHTGAPVGSLLLTPAPSLLQDGERDSQPSARPLLSSINAQLEGASLSSSERHLASCPEFQGTPG